MHSSDANSAGCFITTRASFKGHSDAHWHPPVCTYTHTQTQTHKQRPPPFFTCIYNCKFTKRHESSHVFYFLSLSSSLPLPSFFSQERQSLLMCDIFVNKLWVIHKRNRIYLCFCLSTNVATMASMLEVDSPVGLSDVCWPSSWALFTLQWPIMAHIGFFMTVWKACCVNHHVVFIMGHGLTVVALKL